MKRFYFSLAAPVARDLAGQRLVSGVVEGEDLDRAKRRFNIVMTEKGRAERSGNFAWADLEEIIVGDHGLVVITMMERD